MEINRYIETREKIKDHIVQTPMYKSDFFSSKFGIDVYFKMECYQTTGSCKWRGAINQLIENLDEAKKRGIVSYSSKNYGIALATAAKKFGVEHQIYVPTQNPVWSNKEMEKHGVNINFFGSSLNATRKHARAVAEESGQIFINPSNDENAILGYGTLALEILEEVESIQSIIVPVGQGGLISGLGDVIKQKSPKARVIGVSMEKGAAMMASLHAQKIVSIKELPSMADSLVGNLEQNNKLTFKMVKELANELVTISEGQIINAMRLIHEKEKILCEGAAVVGLAACLDRDTKYVAGPLVIPITGQNCDLNLFAKIVKGVELDSILKRF